jgi:hypothetical protein
MSVGAVAMSLSTIVVAANALLLRRVGTAARGPISAGALYWKRCDLGRLESLLRLFC